MMSLLLHQALIKAISYQVIIITRVWLLIGIGLLSNIDLERLKVFFKSNNYNKEYKDAFKIDLPQRFKLLKNTGSVNELYVHDFAKHFFTCKIFKNIEKPILEAVLMLMKEEGHLDDEVLKYGAFKFKTSDRYLVWKVISRENNEILMKWELGGASGTTWFCIPRDENVLLFGSSFLLPKESYGQKEVLKKEPKQLYIDAARTLDDAPPLVSRIKNTLIWTGLSVTLPIHKLYSKYLLLSTHNKIIKDQNVDRSKPQPFY